MVFALSQNYPNPFNPTTTIKFQIPEQTRVTLEVYSSIGEKIATLVNEVKEAGFYSVLWSGKNDNNQQVATGIYIFRINAGKFSSIKKMMLLK